MKINRWVPRTTAALVACFLTAPLAPLPAEAATYSNTLRAAARQLPLAAENNTGYDRDRFFGIWTDADRDCMNTRHEVLATEGIGERLSSSRCTVVSMTLRSVYDGRTYTSPSQLQIDHLVPVAEAWGSGARNWSQGQRVAFYNDLGLAGALNAMPSAMNQSKGARGPEAWMPPGNRCWYVQQWVAVKHRWRMYADATERAALVRWADACPATMRVAVVRAR